jgi:hypothetical protein
MADGVDEAGSIREIPENTGLRKLGMLAQAARELARAMSQAPGPAASVGWMLDQLIGKKPEMLSEAAAGFPPTRGQGMTLGPRPEFAQDVADLLPINTAASAAVKGVAGKLASLGPAGMLMGALEKVKNPSNAETELLGWLSGFTSSELKAMSKVK